MAANENQAVALYPEDHPRLAVTLQKKLEQFRDEMIQNLADGSATDFPAYREEVGKIRGITLAIEICQEASGDLSRR